MEKLGSVRCYWIGGDEFVVICQGETRQRLEQVIYDFRQLTAITKEGEPSCICAIGLAYSGEICDIEKVVFGKYSNMSTQQ